MEKTILIDGDSIAYMAAIGETEQDVCSIVDEYIERISNRTWKGRFELYVEHPNKNIFRNHVAVTKPYKGNRVKKNLTEEEQLAIKEQRKRINYAKHYMVTKYGAKLQVYVESEDMVAIRAYQHGLENVIIASIDKDMLQIPAEFYNYSKDEQFTVLQCKAEYNFWLQVLTGDATDNIPGLPGIGPKKAYKILEGVMSLESEYDELLAHTVAREYIKRQLPYQYFVEQCRLLRMLRTSEEVYLPPVAQENYEIGLTVN